MIAKNEIEWSAMEGCDIDDKLDYVIGVEITPGKTFIF